MEVAIPGRKVVALRVTRLSKLLFVFALLLSLLTTAVAEPPAPEVLEMFPQRVGEFRTNGPSPTNSLWKEFEKQFEPQDFGVRLAAEAVYTSREGNKYGVTAVRTASDSGAYAMLTRMAEQMRNASGSQISVTRNVGTAAAVSPARIVFFKGATFVSVTGPATGANENDLLTFARQFAETLDKGENQIPVLVQHLPEWETVWGRDRYAVSLTALEEAAGQRPVFDALSFEGGAEAVTAVYGPSRLVIVENTTPQLATNQDARINARLKELREAGQPVPSLYRRVGNYSVFVFDAPDEATAAKLVDGIKYEQVVQWLGDNPNDLKRAQRRYADTTAGVIIAVLKASGLSLLLCLGVGAVFGGIVFRRRRRQQTAQEAFSDAGGMVRLNLDEMTAQYDAGKLLGPSKQ